MEQYFSTFRKHIVGIDAAFETPYGIKPLVYADWIASGRLYTPIEKQLSDVIGPWVGNTHTETSETGTLMTKAYHHAHKLIKQHVNADEHDVIITTGSGMTAVINKLQRMLGLRGCSRLQNMTCQQEKERPVIFITHMEHHSNHTSWFETVADVVVLNPGAGLLVDPDELRKVIAQYKNRSLKIGSFTACSNVTGIITPYYELARIMHEAGGYCFVDFAASAPYVDINMHPADPMEKLDAVMFSPHKFLGGPGSSGVLVFDSRLYNSPTPDQPGGGTVDWTNPWGEYKYIDDIEVREDGGTPGFLQAMKIALSIDLKNRMGVEQIARREEEMLKMIFPRMKKIRGLHILAEEHEERLGSISFYVDGLHYNLLVRLLNDMYGVQVRGGCACAGTYGHYLLDVSYEKSHNITQKITFGDLSEKPGWVRMSVHPTMTNAEIEYILDAIEVIAGSFRKYLDDYQYNRSKNEFYHRNQDERHQKMISSWFNPAY
jgi:selenocysteine lyase/cysteine desulfurase